MRRIAFDASRWRADLGLALTVLAARLRMHSTRNQKGGPRPAIFKLKSTCFPKTERPGRAQLHPTRAEQLLLGLRLFRLFRLLGLLRFLSHSILSRFNGWNATPRHACGGGPTSQHPRWYFEQIRWLLPRAVTTP